MSENPDILTIGKAICRLCHSKVANATCSVCKLYHWGLMVGDGKNALNARDAVCKECPKADKVKCVQCRLNQLKRSGKLVAAGETLESAIELAEKESVCKMSSSRCGIPVHAFGMQRSAKFNHR